MSRNIGTLRERSEKLRDAIDFVERRVEPDQECRLRAMTLQYQPELTHSVWVDTYLSDEEDCKLPEAELIERLKQGVRDGEWVGWRLVRIEREVMGNVD